MYFQLVGRIVQVYKYRVNFEPNEVETEFDTPRYFVTLEGATDFASRRNGTIEPVDYSDYEWMDGIEVADVKDTCTEALRIYEMGKEAYEAELNADPEAERDELFLDFAVRLSLLEMGVTI